jgi:hypothetical protein
MPGLISVKGGRCAAAALVFFSVCCGFAGYALAQASLPIYTDHLVNSFQDWSWGARNLASTSLVHSGANSIGATFVAWEGLSFHVSDLDTTHYDSLVFWASGGASGGQLINLYAELDSGGSLPVVSLAALPSSNAWQQFSVPLSSLGVDSKRDLTRFTFQLTSFGSTNAFYLDDIQLTAKAAPAVVHLNVNAGSAVRFVDARWFGVNTAIWDGNLDTPETISLLRQAGTLTLRCLGGSASDEYRWADNKSLTNTWTWQSSFANLVHVATNVGAAVITTVNYGTGTSNEAAAWVAYANASTTNTLSLGVDRFGTNWHTAGYWASLRSATPLSSDDGRNFLRIGRTAPLAFKYWEIGNECYGTWETDSNSVPHDPYTYAARARDYMNWMRAVDATIKVGVVVAPGEGSYSNNASHFAVNRRTGSTNYGWTPILLTNLAAFGVKPDFLVHHSYAPADCDALLMQFPGGINGWANDAASLRQMLADYMGGAGASVELCVTENNTSSSGKQLTSMVNGLYMAESFGQLMQTEFNSFVWWDLRNSVWTSGNLDPTIYGWRLYGDEGIAADLTNFYPTFYAAKMLQYFARPGDTVLDASSDYSLLSAYAVRRAGGALTVLVINKDVASSFAGQISLNGFLVSSNATMRSYGVPQDEATRTNAPMAAQDIATNLFSGASSNFTYSFPALSLTLFTLSPSAPQLAILPGVSASQVILQVQGQAGVRYVLQTSSDLFAWSDSSTNTLTANTWNLTNSISTGAKQFWRAVWRP